jgi:FSR family fosmidomycin resistance protein-like MFS transporter
MVVLPVGLAFVQESFPNNRSLANGFYLAIVFALNAVAGVTTGFMYDKIGGNSTFLVSGLISFLGIPFIFLLPKESKPAKN